MGLRLGSGSGAVFVHFLTNLGVFREKKGKWKGMNYENDEDYEKKIIIYNSCLETTMTYFFLLC